MKASEAGKKRFSSKTRGESFRHAFSGLAAIARTEPNLKIHLGIFILVVIAGFVLNISLCSWMAILLVSGMVLTAECFNTAVEQLSDTLKPDYDPGIKKVKDIAAAGVLVSAIISVAVGLLVFIPEILQLLNAVI
ncbi:MAG TPA: diacylglycerol kinase family protein [Bacteroidales bacterium]|jgi:diacylglycerol kinase|nr:diacylglycerol kinase family protein [Bacteroidales bacterium]